MHIKYVGPKPIIQHSGIFFDRNKEDKYVYLNIIVQLIKAIDHEYIENKPYTYHTDSKRLGDDEILSVLLEYDPNILDKAEKRLKLTQEEIRVSLDKAHKNKLLDEQNINVLIKNILIMKKYMLQRSFNKSIYYSAIQILADLLKRDHIDYVITPMIEKFIHVFYSVQGVFNADKFPIDSRIDIYEENGELFVKLDVLTLK